MLDYLLVAVYGREIVFTTLLENVICYGCTFIQNNDVIY